MKFVTLKNKKTIWLIAAVALAILAVYIFWIPAVDAAPTPATPSGKSGSALGAAGTAALKGLTWGIVLLGILAIIRAVLGYLLIAAGWILDAAFNLAVRPDWFLSEPVVAGWALVRDFANIWFILILLGIAIMTILKISAPQAKRMLATLIIVAIIINFSLPITRIIIDFGNILAFQFIKAIGNPDKDGYKISNNVSNALYLQELSTALPPGTIPIDQGTGIQQSPPTQPQSPQVYIGINEAHAGWWLLLPKLAAIGKWIISFGAGYLGVEVITRLFSGTAPLMGSVAAPTLVGIIVNIIFLAVAVYVMLALGILMIIRTVILTFLVILAPAGFLLSIIPTTAGYANDWWKMLIKQSLFAPAVAFLLWVTISIAGGLQASSPPAGAFNSSPTAATIFFFTLNVIMLYACLLLAKAMGAIGADTAITWFGKARSWVTGAVGGVALRNTIGRAGEALRATGVASKPTTLGRITRGLGDTMFKAGAKLPFGSREMEQQDKADALFRQGKSTWAKGFADSALGLAGKEAFLRKLDVGQRAELRGNLDPEQQKVLDKIMGVRFGAAEAAKLDIAAFSRLTPAERSARTADLNDDSFSELFRGMKPEEQAEFISRISDPNQQIRAKDLINSPRFSAQEQQNFEIAEIMRTSEDEQRQAYLNLEQKYPSEPGKVGALRTAFLLKKSDEDRARFIAGFRKAPSPTIAPKLTPAQSTAWTNTTADAAEGFIQTNLSAGEYKNYRKAAVKTTSQKAARDLESDVSVMSDEDLDILTEVGDENKVAQVINSFTSSADVNKQKMAKKLGKNVAKRNLQTKYATLLAPRAYVETVEQKEYADVNVDPVKYGEYQKTLQNHLARTDVKVLRKNLSPEIIEQKEFVEDMLTGAAMEDISLVTGDRRRAEAFVRGLESIITGFGGLTLDQKAAALEKEMQARNNNEALRELQEYRNKTSPYQDVITNILQGKPPPAPTKTP